MIPGPVMLVHYELRPEPVCLATRINAAGGKAKSIAGNKLAKALHHLKIKTAF